MDSLSNSFNSQIYANRPSSFREVEKAYDITSQIAHQVILNINEIQKKQNYTHLAPSLHSWAFMVLKGHYELAALFLDFFPEQEILKQYENEKLTNGLSPLHIAAIANQPNLMNKLIFMGFHPNKIDKRGWTALHHAALLGYDKLIEQFNSIINASIKTKDGCTYSDIQRMTKFKGLKDTDLIPVHNEKGQCYTAEQYLTKTGSRYVHEVHLSWKTFLKEKWKAEPTILHLLPYKKSERDQLINEFNLLKQNPLFHQIKKTQEFYGLYASTKLFQFKVIGQCTGSTIFQKNTSYCLDYLDFSSCSDSYDAAKIGNEFRFINDGFPNTSLFIFTKVNQVSTRFFVITNQVINKHTQLLTNYTGENPIKLGPYIEFNPIELRSFLKKNSIEVLIKNYWKVKQAGIKVEIRSVERVKFSQFKYILDTPPVFLRLILDKTLSIKDAVNLFSLMIPLVFKTPELKTLLDFSKQYLDTLNFIEKHSPNLKKDLFNLIYNSTEDYSIVHVLNCMSYLTSFFNYNQYTLNSDLLEKFSVQECREVFDSFYDLSKEPTKFLISYIEKKINNHNALHNSIFSLFNQTTNKQHSFYKNLELIFLSMELVVLLKNHPGITKILLNFLDQLRLEIDGLKVNTKQTEVLLFIIKKHMSCFKTISKDWNLDLEEGLELYKDFTLKDRIYFLEIISSIQNGTK